MTLAPRNSGGRRRHRWAALAVVVAACGGKDDGRAPEALLIAPAYVELGQRAELDGSRSRDPERDIVSYRFIVADGAESRPQRSPTLVHVFRQAGLIDVRLEVIDAKGNVGADRATVSVRRGPPLP